MNIAIVTDSTCDLSPGAEIAYQIDIVPLTVTFGEKSYRDGLDMTSDEFFTRLSKTSVLPVTSQPSPAVFQALFRRRLDEGKDIVGIFLSAMLSGAFQSAIMARSSFPSEEQSRIHLTDSRHATGNLALLVLEACSMRDRGAGVNEILAQLDSLIPRVKLYAILDTLKYLRMGGRLSSVVSTAGSILNIVPVVTIVNGSAAVAAKIHKSGNAFRKWLRERLLSDLPDPRFPAIFLHGNNPVLTAPLQEEFKYLLPREVLHLSIGAVIGTHAGPNVYGLSYLSKK